MRPRAYTAATIVGDINCSSSGHHFVSVRFCKSGKWRTLSFEIGNDWLLGEHGLNLSIPKYFERMVLTALLEKLKAGIRVFEYDREGQERDTELSYHPPGWEARQIERLERILADARIAKHPSPNERGGVARFT